MSYSFDPMDCSLPGSFVHGILQARILEWVAISALTVWTFLGKMMSLVFNIWCKFVIAFLPRSKSLLILF